MIIGHVWLAWLRQTQGDVTGSHDAIRVALQLVQQHQVSPFWPLPSAACCQARLWIAQGNLAAASYWFQTSRLNQANSPGAYLYEVEDVTLVRIEDAVIPGPADDLKNVTVIGTTEQGPRSAWTLLQGADLPRSGTTPDRCPLIVTRHLADVRGLDPGATLNIRIAVPGKASALPQIACRVVGIADFAFATANEYAVATTMSALEAADTTRGPDEADLVLVRSRSSAGGSAAARAIVRVRPDLHAYSNEEVVSQFNQNGFAYFRQVSVVLSSVTLVFAFLLVGTLLTVATNQRLGEIAALRALGISRFRIAAMLLWESALLVGAGGLLALPLGGVLAWRLDRLLRQMPGLPERLHFFVFNSSAIVEHMVLLAATAIVAACYPIWLAARLPIAETLRREVIG